MSKFRLKPEPSGNEKQMPHKINQWSTYSYTYKNECLRFRVDSQFFFSLLDRCLSTTQSDEIELQSRIRNIQGNIVELNDCINDHLADYNYPLYVDALKYKKRKETQDVFRSDDRAEIFDVTFKSMRTLRTQAETVTKILSNDKDYTQSKEKPEPRTIGTNLIASMDNFYAYFDPTSTMNQDTPEL